jgi:hypothetical protein
VSQNIPNGHTIYQHVPFQGPPKYTQIGIFGMQIFHLATLMTTAVEKRHLAQLNKSHQPRDGDFNALEFSKNLFHNLKSFFQIANQS